MENLTQEQQRLPLWKLFFLTSGLMSLIPWNFMLNLTFLFDQQISENFYLYIFLVTSFSSLLSFLFSHFLFQKLKITRLLYICIFVSISAFISTGIILETNATSITKKVTSMVLVVISGFFIATFQRKISTFSSICGPISIKYFAIGTGLSGVGSNMIAIILAMIFPTNIQKLNRQNLSYQLTFYLVFVGIMFIVYLIIFNKYIGRYRHFVLSLNIKPTQKYTFERENDSSNHDFIPTIYSRTSRIKETNHSILSWKTKGLEPYYYFRSNFKRIIDIWMAALFTYVITLETVCYLLPNMTKKFDGGSQLYLLCYYFAYNLGDMIGKMIPKEYMFKSNILIHAFTIFRGVIQLYFVCLICYNPIDVFRHFLIRGLLFFFVGISNGNLTNCYFDISASRFLNNKKKDYSHYLINLSIILGVTSGTFIVLLWEI